MKSESIVSVIKLHNLMSTLFYVLFNLKWRRMIVTIMKLDNVSILVQSCESGLTAFMKRTASPTCCFGHLVVNDKHVVTIVNYDWLSL